MSYHTPWTYSVSPLSLYRLSFRPDPLCPHQVVALARNREAAESRLALGGAGVWIIHTGCGQRLLWDMGRAEAIPSIESSYRASSSAESCVSPASSFPHPRSACAGKVRLRGRRRFCLLAAWDCADQSQCAVCTGITAAFKGGNLFFERFQRRLLAFKSVCGLFSTHHSALIVASRMMISALVLTHGYAVARFWAPSSAVRRLSSSSRYSVSLSARTSSFSGFRRSG